MNDASVPATSGRAAPGAETVAASAEPLFDAEKLDVYRVAVEFQALAAHLIPRRGQSALRDQLERASVSIVLKIAEGVVAPGPLPRENLPMRTFILEYWQDEGWYVGRLKEVPGVMSQAQTLAELEENIRDAYHLMTDTEPAPPVKPVLTREIEV